MRDADGVAEGVSWVAATDTLISLGVKGINYGASIMA